MTNKLTKAMQDVVKERTRQITKKGHTPEGDDFYHAGELSLAGAAYAAGAYDNHREGRSNEVRMLYPWDERTFKPRKPRKALVVAAALILAEIERIDRAEAPKDDQ